MDDSQLSAVETFAASQPWPLDSFQVEAITKLEESRGVLVSAPTSSGKTVVADYAIWRALEAPARFSRKHHRVIYTTPLKALSNQKYRDLCERYGEDRVGLVTGEHTVNDGAAVVVMTTEILRNIIYEQPDRLDTVGDVVLDEVHYIDDYPRGTVWEEVIIEAPLHIRFIGLSATISNVEEVADWITGLRGPVATVKRTQRPVALEMWLAVNNHLHPLFDPSGAPARRTLELAQNSDIHDVRFRYSRQAPENDMLAVIGDLQRRQMLPAIYFIFSRRGCREALARCAVQGITLSSPAERKEIHAEWTARLEAIDDQDERDVFAEFLDEEMLTRGIAMHHAGMLPYAKETVEKLFQRGLIKVVFATETLSLGLNMPARACVVSSFTKFNGTDFQTLTSGELIQLMGRAGRRGIDTVGHGIVLKEAQVDVRDIYDAAIGDEMAVVSKFAPTYTMILGLLRSRTPGIAEALVEKSFGQYQRLRADSQWSHREHNAQLRLDDLRRHHYRHPRIPCTEKTLSTHLRLQVELEHSESDLRRAKRSHWQDRRRGRYGGGSADPGQRVESLRRRVKSLGNKLDGSPCRHCPLLADHQAQRAEILELEDLLTHGEAELRDARDRYRREFRALCAILREGGFLDGDSPSDLGMLAASLYGESALLVADAVASGRLTALSPAELAATLVMLVAEDRGRDRPHPSSHRYPTPGVERAARMMRSSLHRLRALEERHGVNTLRVLSHDYVAAAFEWVKGTPLMEIDAPPNSDIGDVVKAMKNLYSMLRQMEQALVSHPLRPHVIEARKGMERDLIRRI